MSVLTRANNEWSTRPADERYGSLREMHARATEFRTNAAVAKIKADALRVVSNDGNIALAGQNGNVARLTNWSFGQLAERAKAPGGYLATLPSEVAVAALNASLDRNAEKGSEVVALMDRTGGNLSMRGMTSDKYSRIWNSDITARLLELEARGPWQPAPAAFDGSRGLYLGDRDMFAFLVDNERRIFEKDAGGGLSRGFLTWNSEVGGSAFGFMSFLYEYVCGNHRIWGATNIAEFRVIHIGRDQATKAFDKLRVELRKYAESSAADDEARVEAARQYEIGATKDEVLDAVFGLKVPVLTRKVIGQAYDLAEQRVDRYGSPRSAWGIAGALTETARDLPNANERFALDNASAKVMEMAF